MGFPRKISELPLRTVLKNTDLFVSVDVDTDITNKVTLESLASFIGGENQYVTGGTYNELTETIDFVGNEGFPPFSIDVSKLAEDTYVTGGSLNGAILEIDRNNGEPTISIDLSPLSGDTNTFVTGTSLNNTIYTINQNDGSSFSTDFEPLISGFTTGNTLQEVLDNGSIATGLNSNVEMYNTDGRGFVFDSNNGLGGADFQRGFGNILLNGFEFYSAGGINKGNYGVEIRGGADSLIHTMIGSSGTRESRLELRRTRAEFYHQSSGDTQGIEFGVRLSNNHMLVTDEVNSKGLEYASDYSSNFTNESLVTKRYVTGLTSTIGLQEVLDNGSVASLTNKNVKITMTPADTNDLVFEMDSSNSFIRMNHSGGGDLTWFQLKHDAVEMKNHLGSDYYYWNVPQPGTSNMKFQGVRSSVGANNYSGLEVNLTSSLLKTRQTQTGNSYSQIEVNQQDILLKYNNVVTGSDTEIEISDTGIELKLEGDTSGERKFNQYRDITSGSIFTDSVGSVGIGYANDYSLSGITQLGDRWIPDKGWVDNRISGFSSDNFFVTGGTYNSGTTSLDFVGNSGFSPFSVGVQPLISPFEVTGTQGAVQPKDSSYTNTTQGTVWLGGTVSKIMGDYNFIGNGINHNIEAVADYSFIGNGNNNHLGDGVNQVAYSAILAGKDNTIDGTVFNSAIIAGENNTITHSNTFILGSNISSTQTGTTYVENLNIGSLGSGISVNNLGIDASGNVVVGSSGTSSTDTYVTGATLNGNTLEIERNNGLSAVTVDLSSLSASTPTIDEVIAAGNQLTNTNNSLDFPLGGSIDWSTSGGQQNFYISNGSAASTYIRIVNKGGELEMDDSMISLASFAGKDLELKTGGNTDDFRIYLGTNGPSVGDVLEVKSLDGNTGLMGWATPTVPDNVFVLSGDANAATQQLTFTNTTGGTFNVTNAAALFSDNDINVTGGTYNPTTGCITFSTNSGSTFDVCGFVTGLTDTYTSSGIYDNNTAEITFTRTDASTYTVDLSTLDLNETFSTGGTVTQSPSSGSSEVTVQIVGNEGFTPYNITGLTDTFVNDFSFSSNTFTISQNDGSSFDANLDTIDLSNILSGVSFDIATSGSISATTFNGGTFVGDGSGLSGITQTLQEVLDNGSTATISASTFSVLSENGVASIKTNDGTVNVESGLILQPIRTKIYIYNNGGDEKVIDMVTAPQSGIQVKDDIDFIGMYYGSSNYEINAIPQYGDSWIPHVGYVKTLISGSTSGSTQNLQNVLTVGNETSGNDIIMTEGDDVVFKYSGWNNRINTNPLTTHRNILFPDKSGTVALLSDTTGHTENFYVTGFDYNDANTFTLTRNGGLSALTTTINTMTGLTVNGTLVVDTISATTINGSVSGLTLTSLDDVTSNIPSTPDNTYQGRLLYFDATDNQWLTGEEYVSTGNVTIWAKKGSAGTIDKGCPVYITGFDNDIHEVELANASTGSTMPVIGFTAEDFDNSGIYPLITFGKLSGIDTTSATTVVNPFGETWEVNDVLYMAKTDGGLTKFRPTGSDTRIQRIAKVLNVGTTNGQIFIFNTARTAGLPNLTTDYLWLGNGNDTPLEVIRTDVGITTTGFTYNDNNTFTITDDNGGSLSTTINQMSGLTINGDLTVTGNTQLDSNLIVEGLTTLRGQTTIGNSFGDTLDIVSRLTSSIVPSSDNTVDLGDGTRRWRNIYGHNITGDTLNIGTLGTGTSVTNLGIDGSGNVVSGTTGGSGEVNTASNLGGGTGLFAQKNGVDLEFKSITSTGGTVTITNNSTTVNIESTGGGTGVNDANKIFSWFMNVT